MLTVTGIHTGNSSFFGPACSHSCSYRRRRCW